MSLNPGASKQDQEVTFSRKVNKYSDLRPKTGNMEKHQGKHGKYQISKQIST